MTDIAPIDPQETNSEGLQPLYKAYVRQKCFIGYSERAVWRKGLLQACREVLQEPEFDLEADYAREHYASGTSLHEKALELIANARYGIYDLSSWEEPAGQWRMPGNVLIELGMAIALNRPAMLLRHSANRQAGLTLPPSLESLEIVEFSGYTTLKAALRAALPKWIREDPAQAWQSRQCHTGGRECEHREGHPRARRLSLDRLCCHVSDGQDVDRDDFRSVVETEIGRFSDVEWSYLDALPPVPGYAFLLCSHCQAVRSNPLGLYRVTPHTPAETFIAIGMTLGLEKQFGYRIPKMFVVQSEDHLPSLLKGLDRVQAHNDIELKEMLRQYLPEVLRQVRQLPWRRSPLPFISATDVTDPDLMPANMEDKKSILSTEPELPSEPVSSEPEPPSESVSTEPVAVAAEKGQKQFERQDPVTRTCPSCGNVNRSTARFCAYCRTLLIDIQITQIDTQDVVRSSSASFVGMLPQMSMLHNRYRILEKRGQGHLSTVYRAADIIIAGKLWAIKEMNGAALTTTPALQEAVLAFEREAKMLTALNHRNLPTVTDYFEESGNYYLVMEFINGDTLQELMMRSPIPMSEDIVLSWADQLCDVLDYLHSRRSPVIFRCLQASNVMVDSTNQIKLIDFGIARHFTTGKDRDSVTFGTAGYAAPEQYGRDTTDTRADIYALGATLHYLLTGRDPIQGPPFIFPSVRITNPSVSPAVDAAVLRALESNRSQRWPSAAAMRSALHSTAQSNSVASTASAQPQSSENEQQSNQRRWPWQRTKKMDG